ncbi:MAG TPA: ABC transporter permease [Thermoanaerobaculia bacterium]|nr:ABC transporter permease [Thermoanaerobaculia bacterium]
MEFFIQDLRLSARTLAKSPVFTTMAVLTLALGIGANAAIFSFFKSTALHPLPFPEAERLVNIHGTLVRDGEMELRGTSYPDFRDWAAQARSVESIAGFSQDEFNLVGEESAERVEVGMVTPGYFRVYGFTPQIGRAFREEENQAPSGTPVTVLSHRLWQQRFGSDPGVLGKTLILSGVSFQVIGVMPERFRGSWGDTDLWIPVRKAADLMPNRAPEVFDSRGSRWLEVIARLAPGRAPEELQSEMSAISSRLSQEYADTNVNRGAKIIPLEEDLLGEVQGTFRLLFGAVALVLLIACTNVTNLLMARTTNRRKEVAIRAAIGAPRSRLALLVAAETLLLGLLGGIVGLGVGRIGVSLLQRYSPLELPEFVEVGVDPVVFGFALVLSLLTGLLLGLLPAAQVINTDLTRTLKDARGAAQEGLGGIRRLRSQNLLVAAEVAIAVPVLIGAGLVLQSFHQQQSIEPGFSSEELLTFQVHLPPGVYPEGESIAAAQRLHERIKVLPGVDTVALASDLPLSGTSSARLVAIEDQLARDPESEVRVYQHLVSPEFFAATGIPLLQGSGFTPHAPGEPSQEVVVSKALADEAWPGQSPLGKRIVNGSEKWIVVGVAGDVRYRSLLPDPEGNPDDPDIYRPILQTGVAKLGVVVKSRSDPAALTNQVRQAVRELDPSLPVFEVTTMREAVAEETALGRFSSLLFGLFGALALFLIGIGIYGVTNYSVSQRRREIGIRMAIGARPAQVLLQVLREGLWIVLMGLGLGLFTAYASTRLLQNILFGVGATDILTFVAGVLIVLALSVLACYAPARRASRLDPLLSLKQE